MWGLGPRPHTIDVVGKLEGQDPRSQAVHLGFHQLVIRRAFQAGVQHAFHARHALQVAGHRQRVGAVAQWRSTRIPSPTVRFAPAICVTFMSEFVGIWKFTWRGYARARLKSLIKKDRKRGPFGHASCNGDAGVYP